MDPLKEKAWDCIEYLQDYITSCTDLETLKDFDNSLWDIYIHNTNCHNSLKALIAKETALIQEIKDNLK
jgi:hypothetical protein